jgi:hypothetical protein
MMVTGCDDVACSERSYIDHVVDCLHRPVVQNGVKLVKVQMRLIYICVGVLIVPVPAQIIVLM